MAGLKPIVNIKNIALHKKKLIFQQITPYNIENIYHLQKLNKKDKINSGFYYDLLQFLHGALYEKSFLLR